MAASPCAGESLSTAFPGLEPESKNPEARNQTQLVDRRLDELFPHPFVSKHRLAFPSCQMSAPREFGDQTSNTPIAVTVSGLIIDGYAGVESARQRRTPTILCIEYDLSENEALLALLRRQSDSIRLNAFCRILLARELEPWFKAKAIANQKAGGKNKGSSKLTEAQKVDVTAEIARAADVSTGTLSKVKQLLTTAIPPLVDALRRGNTSIHAAWLLSKKPLAIQRQELQLPECHRNIKKDMRILVARHRSKNIASPIDGRDLFKQLSAVDPDKKGPVQVVVSNVSARVVCVAKELLNEISGQKELYVHDEESIPEADSN